MELIEDIKTMVQEHSGIRLKKWLNSNKIKNLYQYEEELFLIMHFNYRLSLLH